MRGFILILILFALLVFAAGCSVGWHNPYITDKDEEHRAFMRDSNFCDHESLKADYDRRLSTYEACMDARGWVRKE